MSLYSACIARRSFTSFRDEELNDAIIDELVDFLSELEPPAEDIDWNFDTLPYLDMLKLTSREPVIKAPHYLVLRAERKLFSLQMCGYIGEMAVLHLTDKGIATRWIGNTQIDQTSIDPNLLPFVGVIAFGYSDEDFRQSPDFDRADAAKTCFGNYSQFKAIMDAGRYAPSWMNKQPCAFVADEKNMIHVYRKKVFMNNPIISYQQCLDSGAALANLEVAAKENGFPQAHIFRLSSEPIFKHMIYQASLALE